MRETMENGVYQAIDNDGEIMLIITALGNNIYRAVNRYFDITAEIIPLDDYRTSLMCIENKKADKNCFARQILRERLVTVILAMQYLGIARVS